MFEPKTLRHFQHELDHMLRSAGDQDPEGLAELAEMLRRAADEGLRGAAAEQRKRNGWSWAQYARAFAFKTAYAAQKRLDPEFGPTARAAAREAGKPAA